MANKTTGACGDHLAEKGGKFILPSPPFQLLLPADFKIRAASTIHPNAASVTAPGAALNAGRTAALANQTDLAADAFMTPMTFSIAGFTVERLNVTATIPISIIIPIPISISIPIPIPIPIPAPTRVAVAKFKISAAAAIHPDSPPVITPCATLYTL
ncbi:MAG TPA: hypothetical protein VGB07_12405 [Blastocatellia bacterium]